MNYEGTVKIWKIIRTQSDMIQLREERFGDIQNSESHDLNKQLYSNILFFLYHICALSKKCTLFSMELIIKFYKMASSTSAAKY